MSQVRLYEHHLGVAHFTVLSLADALRVDLPHAGLTGLRGCSDRSWAARWQAGDAMPTTEPPRPATSVAVATPGRPAAIHPIG